MTINPAKLRQQISQFLKRLLPLSSLSAPIHPSTHPPIHPSTHPPISLRRLIPTTLFLLTLLLTLSITALTAPTLSSPPPQSPLASPDPPAAEWIDQGRDFYADGQYNQAAVSWRQAAQVYANQGDALHQAMALTYLSLAHQQLDQWTEAETAISASLDLLTQAPERGDSFLRSQLYAQALNARGRLYFALGRLEGALHSWDLAAETYRNLNDSTGVVGSLINQAQALESLGLYRRSCNTLLTALAVDARCDNLDADTLPTLVQTIESYPDPAIQTLGLRSLGTILRLVDSLDRSSQVLKAGLAIAEQQSSPPDQSAAWLALGETERARYQQVKESLGSRADSTDVAKLRHAAQPGIQAYQQAAQLAQIAGQSSPIANLIQIQAQLQRLSLLLDLQAWLQDHQQTSDQEKAQIQLLAQRLLAQSLTELPPSRPTLYAQLNLARNVIQLRQIDGLDPASDPTEAALQLASAGLTAATDLEDARGESYSLGVLGGLYEQLQDWSQALSFTQLALARAQTAQADEMKYQWQWQLGRIYAAQSQTLLAIDAYRQALNTLQPLRRDLAFLNPDIQFSFRENVEPVYRQLVNLLLEPETPSLENLKQARTVMDSLQLAVVENFLHQACSDATLEEIDQVVDQTDATAAFIYTVILDDRLEVILKLPQPQALQSYRVAAPKAEIEATLTALQRSLQQKLPSRRTQIQTLSKQVYDWLVAPAAAALEQSNVSTVTFVLDGQLRNIPIAALYDGEQYLIQKYAVAVTPGLQLLGPQPLERKSMQALVAGSAETIPNTRIRPLPGVMAEVESIKTALKNIDVLLNRAFTQQTLGQRINLRPVPIIHIATHGQFSSRSEDTYILAGDGDRININELAELLRRRDQTQLTPIEILFLSACQTVTGDDRASLGMAGVAVRSGARSTIASLWYADDEATAQLVGRFYHHLSDPNVPTKAKALQLAQQDLLNNPRLDLPVYWAPYVLVGNWL
ncbi:MAG: CHAT domain-containing protein [Leptolyngbyaceae cyanobacterium MO_188.B28]|nr:CHAT domain-containing protein [Leptolyngbyaceae cyanobacterium MO_188.B28]